MRSILCLTLLALPAFATGLDGQKLGRLLGLVHHDETVSEAVPSPLPWRLLGTLRARDGASFAAVECSSRSVTLQVGDVRDGAEVIAIEQQALVVRRQGRLERVGGRPGVAAPSATAARPLSRELVGRLLANPEPLLREVQLLPAFVAGKLTGFRARWVKEGSLVASLGLRAGDLITRVNGLSFDDPQRIFALVQGLGTTRRFEVELERDGQRVVQAVELDR